MNTIQGVGGMVDAGYALLLTFTIVSVSGILVQIQDPLTTIFFFVALFFFT